MASTTEWPDGYSTSCQTALRFAWAVAAVRQGQPAPNADTVCNLEDVLVGTMLTHAGTSEPEQCFRHFGLVAGQVLAPDFPRLTGDALGNRRLDALASGEMPPLESDVMQVLELAARRSLGTHDGRIHLEFLWSGILRLPQGTMTTALMTMFESRGTSLADVSLATEEWIDATGSTPYPEWLITRFPNPQHPTTVVNFKADTTDAAASASGDLLQIGREVDAFAYLLASRDIRPPLAIGLFGDWGSGKTFFMNSVRRRIDTLLSDPAVTQQPQGRTPFWKRVIPIEFNAWHYAEGDLLASLVDHIFTHLRTATYGRAHDPVAAEREGWIKSLDENLRQLNDKRTELTTAEQEITTLEHEVTRLETERAEALETLDERVANAVLGSSTKAVLGALGSTAESAVDAHLTVGQARQELDAARTESRRAFASVQWLGRSKSRIAVAIVAMLLVPVVVGVIDWLADSGAISAAAGFSAVGVELLALSTAFARRYLDRLDAARAEVEAEAATIRAAHQKGIDDKVSELDAKRDEVNKKRITIATLEVERANLQRELATPAGIRIRQFLDERIGSGEYRVRLGVPAIVRNDLERLSSYIRAENDQIRDSEEKVTSEVYDVNRIVLYIDDLDRCADEKVIEVLQAVHLLLAFELFIVVVAVDARWLSYALMKEYPALGDHASPGGPGEQAQPRDYLEKIFQIPFLVRPLGDDGRTSIARGLLGDHLRADDLLESGGAVSPVMRYRVRDREEAVLDQQIAIRQPPASLATEAFTLTRTELTFIESLAPLLGATPRAVKRFVNLYQLLRVILVEPDTEPERGPGAVSERELASFLLAVGNTDADFGARLLATPPATLAELSELDPPTSLAPVPVPVAEWLRAAQPRWATVTRERIQRIGTTVERFSFGN